MIAFNKILAKIRQRLGHAERKPCVEACNCERLVFISHSSKDTDFATRLAASIRAKGIKPWVAEQSAQIGESIIEQVEQALAESTFFLLVVSEHGLASKWVKKEMQAALTSQMRGQRLTIIPLRIDDADVPLFLRDIKWVDFSESYEKGLAKLLAKIA